ncbi:MAG: hypothetical protein AB1324_03120 [Candidatus Micrarchaeota archaeon]
MGSSYEHFLTHGRTGQPYPRRLQSSFVSWARAYERFGGADAIPHVKRVLDKSIDHSMVETDKLASRFADPKQLNLKLSNVILAHVFRRSKTNRLDLPTDEFGKHQLVVDGFNAFDALRENDLGQQDPKVYGRLLERPSLGLLARMVDLTEYGTSGLASEHELAGLDPERFYSFDNLGSKTEYEKVALAARKVYSPLADLFGYRQLAGDLMEIVYFNLHKGIYDEVQMLLGLMQSKIEGTRRVMEAVKSHLSVALASEGYKFSIVSRTHKHPGKVMEKAHRYSLRDGRSIGEHVSELHDLAAFTVVLHSKNGRRICQNDAAEFERVGRLIVGITRSVHPLKRGLDESGIFTDMVRNPKPNGYQSFHVDLAFESQDLVGLEAIVRDPKMHEYSERGGAAHFLYKGGEQARQVENAYRNVKDAIEKGGAPAQAVSITDTHNYRRVKIFVEGEPAPRIRVVPSGACVGEALICADVDLTNGLVLEPKVSLLSPINGMTELRLVHSSGKGEMISYGVIDQLLNRAILDSTREKLWEMKTAGRK